jgi:hypothetical protein
MRQQNLKNNARVVVDHDNAFLAWGTSTFFGHHSTRVVTERAQVLGSG